MKKAFIALALLGFFLTNDAFAQITTDDGLIDYRTPKTYQIGGIEVDGAQYSNKSTIIAVSGLKKDKSIKIPGPDITKAMQQLWKLDLFTNVEIYINKTIEDVAFLSIKVEERPRLSRFSYKGAKKGHHDDLNDKVQRFAQRGRIVTENVKQNSKNALEAYYVEKGYLDASVDVIEIKDSLLVNSERLVFDVDRGKRIKIKDIIINGNTEVVDRKFRKKLKNTKAQRNLLKGSKYVKADYEDDKEAVRQYYNTIGFRDARITRDSIYRVGNKLVIEMDVQEGEQYYFGDISFKGNAIYSNERLEEVLGIEKGDIYDEGLLQSRLNFAQDGRDVTSIYMDNGYLFFRIDPVEVRVENDTIDLEIRIFEGPQATIDKVVIKGNDRTHEHVIRRELRTKPGQKFSRSDIIRSQREILALGYFNQENLGINTPVNQSRGTVDIEYTVEERPSDQLELSAGWGGQGRGIIGTLGVTFNNFSLRNMLKPETWSPLPQGDGQRLSIRAQTNGKVYQSYNFSLTEPWLGGKKPNSFTFSAFHSRSTNGQLKEAEELYGRLAITGASVSLGTRLKKPDDFFVSSSSLSYQNIDLVRWPGFGSSLNNGSYHSIAFNQTISRNSIDSPIFPTSGAKISLSVQFTPPYSLFRKDNFWKLDGAETQDLLDELGYTATEIAEDEVLATRFVNAATALEGEKKFKFAEYHKWRFNAEWYSKLFGKFVLKTSTKIGLLGSYNDAIGITPFERYELGGDGISNYSLEGKDLISLRGYDTQHFPANASGGAVIFDKFTLEVRYPISLNPQATIYVLSFLEGGNAWSSWKDFNPLEIKRSAGAGVRIFLPMFGTLGFDYGFGFDRPVPSNANKPADGWGRFSIILGFEPE